MNDTQTLVLIHAVAWPILIWLLSKTWATHDFPAEPQIDDESRPVVPQTQSAFHLSAQQNAFRRRDASTIQIVRP
jgi:hypothetical protein